MAVTSTRSGAIAFSGDVAANVSFTPVTNTQSPGSITIHSLTTGANVITLPTGGSSPNGAVVIPPPGNTIALTLKGTSADTGIALHLTAPAIVTFSTSPPASIVLNAANVVTGLRVVWT